MTNQEALEIIDKKLAKKVGKPPLKKSELIEAMAQALLKKRMAEKEEKEEAHNKASEKLKLAALKQLHARGLEGLLNADTYFTDYQTKIVINVKTEFPNNLFPKEIEELKNNPPHYYSLTKLDIRCIRNEIRAALATKGPSRISELLKDPAICKKFEQMAEEVLTTSATVIETTTT